jgi:hypothetical protein
MLFLRQLESLERTKRTYNQLRKIGITRQEFSRAVMGEIRVIFITPVVFGVINGFSLMLITEAVVGGADLVMVFMKNATVLTAIYIVFQLIACQWAGVKFLGTVNNI